MKTKIGKVFYKYLINGRENEFFEKVSNKLHIPFNMVLEYVYDKERDIIYEGLTFSKDVDYVFYKLKKEFIDNKVQKSLTSDKSSININSKENKLSKKLESLLNVFGWYWAYSLAWIPNKMPQRIKPNDIVEDASSYVLYFEPKYDTEFLNTDFKYLYHLSPDFYLNKITLQGLTPKSKSKGVYYPERIYFFKEYDLEFFKKIAKNLDKYVNPKAKKIYGDYTFCLFKVDISNLNLRLFQDPNLKEGIYTLQNIPSSNIKFMQNIKI